MDQAGYEAMRDFTSSGEDVLKNNKAAPIATTRVALHKNTSIRQMNDSAMKQHTARTV